MNTDDLLMTIAHQANELRLSHAMIHALRGEVQRLQPAQPAANVEAAPAPMPADAPQPETPTAP